MNSTRKKVSQLRVYWLLHAFGWRSTSCLLVSPETSSEHSLLMTCMAICFRGRSLDTIESHFQQAVNAIQEWATGNGFRFVAHKCKVVHFTAPHSRTQWPPTVRIGNTPQWRSRRNSSGFGEIRVSLSRNTSGRWKPSARRPSISSEWLHTWSGVGTETPSWCCTGPLSVPS